MASSKRERELARMRAERQAARRAAAEARRRKQRATLLAIVSAVAVVAVAVGAYLATRGGDKKETVTSQPTATAGAGTGTCTYSKSGTATKAVAGLPPSSGVRTTGVQKAVLTTSRGPIEANLLTSKAPCTVNSFAYLAGQKYFNDTPCHRLTTSGIYVLQCGDPSGKGTGGPGYKFPDENLTGAVYPKGTLAMANGGPGTNGSQFFLVYKDTQLPPSYTPFGTITKGLDILTAVAKGGSNPPSDGKPKLAIKLTKVTVQS